MKGAIHVHGDAIILGGTFPGAYVVSEGVWAGPNQRLTVTMGRNDRLRLSPNATVENLTISGSCYIGSGAVVKNSTLSGEVSIQDHAVIQDCHIEHVPRIGKRKAYRSQILIQDGVLQSCLVMGASITIEGNDYNPDPHLTNCVIHGDQENHTHLKGIDWSNRYIGTGSYADSDAWQPIVDKVNAPLPGVPTIYHFVPKYLVVSMDSTLPTLESTKGSKILHHLGKLSNPTPNCTVELPGWWMPAEHRIPTPKGKHNRGEPPKMCQALQGELNNLYWSHIECSCGWEHPCEFPKGGNK